MNGVTTIFGGQRTGRLRGTLLLTLAMLALIAALIISAPEARSQAAGGGAHLGVASCAGSTCHGRMEGDGARVRQDEIMRWQDPATPTGAHSRAFTVLANARSQGIARNLGIGDATSAPMCLGCHTSANSAGGGAFRYQQSDGVDCEACHGPAGGWISAHYSVGATHADNVRRGLRPLENPRTRAALCLDCHYGSTDEGQFVSHRIMAAGHPRISFELDLFSTLQAHHTEDADYVQRKGRTDHVQMWAVGQAMALQRSLTLFQDNRRATEGVFPEFTFFDCHSCHRRIYDQAQAVRTGVDNPARPIPEGMAPYNDENMIMLAAAARMASPALSQRFDARVQAFHAALARDRGAAVAAARDLSATAGDLADAFSGGALGANAAPRLAQAIASEAIRPRFTDYQGSVQAVMGVDTLLGAMVSAGDVTVGAAAGIRADINRAYAAVADPNAYRPRDFQTALGSAVRAIGAVR